MSNSYRIYYYENEIVDDYKSVISIIKIWSQQANEPPFNSSE